MKRGLEHNLGVLLQEHGNRSPRAEPSPAAAAYWDLFWPQLLQGTALGLLFVPLTTVTMADITREEMGNASSLVNLMRNVGSSIGIAAVTPILAQRRVLHGQVLSEHVNPYAPQAAQMLANLQAYFRSRGADAMTAMQRAYAASRGLVAREAALLAFIDVFFLMGAIFVAAIPLLFVMRKPAPRQGAAPVAAAKYDLPSPSPSARRSKAGRRARPDRSAKASRGRWDISRSSQ